jgi:hypothetical protein
VSLFSLHALGEPFFYWRAYGIAKSGADTWQRATHLEQYGVHRCRSDKRADDHGEPTELYRELHGVEHDVRRSCDDFAE